MAEFKVVFSNGRKTKYSGDDARYDIDGQNAVLVVFDGKGNRLHFSQTAWISIEDKSASST